MTDGNKRVWSFNEGILHCRNLDMGNNGSKRIWQFIGGRYDEVLLYVHEVLVNCLFKLAQEKVW